MPPLFEHLHPLRNPNEHRPFARQFDLGCLHRYSDVIKTALILICILSATISFAQIPATARLVGTNVIDFTPISRSKTLRFTNTYWISGAVGQVTDNGVLIRRFLGTWYHHAPQAEIASRVYGTSGLLTVLAGYKMSPNGKISPGEFFTMSPEMQFHFKRVDETEVVILTNCPPELAKPGQDISIFAMPAGDYIYETVGYGFSTVKRFDAGIPILGMTNLPRRYFQITTNGPVLKPKRR